MVEEKRCFKCGVVKVFDAFYVHKAMKDGHLNKCKECTKIYVARYRNENLDRIREYERERAVLPHRIELKRE
jgi:hypothetical protein